MQAKKTITIASQWNFFKKINTCTKINLLQTSLKSIDPDPVSSNYCTIVSYKINR